MNDENLSHHEQIKKQARERYTGCELRALVEAMAALRIRRDNVDAELSALNAEYDVLRQEAIPDKMDAEGIEKIAYDGIGRVSLTGDLMLSVKDKVALIGWLEENGFGDLIQPTVNASTLKAFVKGRMKSAKSLPEEFLSITPFTRASITKV